MIFLKKTVLFFGFASCLGVGGNVAGASEFLPVSQWELQDVSGYGSVDNCRVSRSYDPGVSALSLHFYEQNWADIFIAFDAAVFRPGDTYTAQISGHGGYDTALSARALSKNKLVLQVKETDSLLQALQYVRGIDVDVSGASYSFANPQQQPLFDVLSSCFKDGSFDRYSAKNGGTSVELPVKSDVVKLVRIKDRVTDADIKKSSSVVVLKRPVKKMKMLKLAPVVENVGIAVQSVAPAAGGGFLVREAGRVEIQEQERAAEVEGDSFERLSRFPKKIKSIKKVKKKPVQVVSDSDAFASPGDIEAQKMERQYAQRIRGAETQMSSRPLAYKEESGVSRVFKEVLGRVAGKKGGGQKVASGEALDFIRKAPAVVDLGESCNAQIPESMEHLMPYIAGNGNSLGDQELVESLKVKMQLLEREKEALRQNKAEEPGALSVVRVCTQEKDDVKVLAKRLGELESQNFELSQLQENLQAVSGSSEDLDAMQINIDELMLENESLQKSMQEMRSYMNEFAVKNSAHSEVDENSVVDDAAASSPDGAPSLNVDSSDLLEESIEKANELSE